MSCHAEERPLEWRMHPHYLLQELHDCTHCSWETKVQIHRKNPPASSPLPLPNPAHLVFNIHKGSLFPFPTTWNLEFSSKAEQDMNLARPLLAGPSASSFAKACFQVQSLSTVPQWINLIKEDNRSQLLVPKPLGLYATVTPPAYTHGHAMKNRTEILLLQAHNNLWTQTDVQRWKGKWSCWVPFLTWQKHTHKMTTSYDQPHPLKFWEKGEKKAQLMRIAALFTPQ